MLKEADIEVKYSDEEYQEHINGFHTNEKETQERFQAWIKNNTADLKRIYCRRVMEDEIIACTMPYTFWVNQMFIAWDCNQVKEQQLDNEMKEMMGEV